MRSAEIYGHKIYIKSFYTFASSKIAKSKTCCAGSDILDAKRIASTINIPHYVLDYEAIFKAKLGHVNKPGEFKGAIEYNPPLYLKFKNKLLGDAFLKQVILDWVNGDIKDNTLSKNVAIR